MIIDTYKNATLFNRETNMNASSDVSFHYMWIIESVALLYVTNGYILTITKSVAVLFGTFDRMLHSYHGRHCIFIEVIQLSANLVSIGTKYECKRYNGRVQVWVQPSKMDSALDSWYAEKSFLSFLMSNGFNSIKFNYCQVCTFFHLYKLTVFTVIPFYTFLYRFKRVHTVIWIDFKRKTGI